MQLYINGKRESKVADTRKEAASWALARESELTGKRLPDRTLRDALERFGREVSESRLGARWELVRLKKLSRLPMAGRKLASLTATDIAEWRDMSLLALKPASVAREMNLLRSVFEIARTEWGWIRFNPMTDVKRPPQPRGRARRVMPDEIEAIAQAFDVVTLKAHTAQQRVGLAFLFALETAMRSGEIVTLRGDDVFIRSRYLIVRKSKNGDSREVPLSTRAIEILNVLPPDSLFGLNDALRDAIWRKHRPEHLADLRFHDTRGEAIWRLSKHLDVLQLGRAIGHRDPKSLYFYYRESGADMARLLP